MKTEEEYYLVSVELQQVKAHDGSTLTKDGETGWLGITDDHYPQIYSAKGWAKQFKEFPNLSDIGKWDGMPWYCRIKPDSSKVYKVQTTKTVTETREEVQL